MKKILNFIIIFVLFTSNIFASDEIEIGKTLLKSLSKKSLTKEETFNFLKEYAIILEDERGDGEVTYVFDDENYYRHKGTEVISTDAWRFSKLGALRLFNKDIKLTWKIKPKTKKTENLINIKAKFDPVGKLYKFTVMDKKDFLDQIEQAKQAEIQKKEAIEKARIEKKKKQEQDKLVAEQKLKEEKSKLEKERLAAEQKLEEEKRKFEEERLAAEQKLEEEKKKLEEEKLALQKEIEELKIKKAENLEKNKKTPEQILKEEKERLKQEKLAAKQIAKEEKERKKQELLARKKEIKEREKKIKEEKIAKLKSKDEKSLNIEKHKLCMKMIEASFYQDWDNKIFKNKIIKKGLEAEPEFKENLKGVRMMLVMGSTNPKKRKGVYHWDDFAGMGMLLLCPPDRFNLELTDINY